MRRVTLLLGMLISLTLALPLYAQNTSKVGGNADVIDYRIDNMGYWMKLAEKGLVPYNPFISIPAATFKGSGIQTRDFITDSPDVPVTTVTSTQSENSVFIDPDDNTFLINSNNSTDWSGGSASSVLGADYLKTNDAGATYTGSINGAGGSNSGDPTTAINRAGRQFVNFIDDPGGQGVAYTDNGSTWSTATIGPNPGSLADKNHMWIDNSLSSPYIGNLYCVWTDFGGSYNYEVVFSRSTDNGATWSTRVPVSGTISTFDHGVNVQTGPNGEVYACWATYPSSGLTENGIGFAKSLDGGLTFSTPVKALSTVRGIREDGVSKNMRVNSFPVMAVDVSGGPNNGNLYIVWSNIGVPGTNTGTNISVYMIRSADGGNTWSTPVRVNQGTYTEGKESYCPWISCDSETGNLSVVFYDDRNTASTDCEAWTAISLDAGNTWQDFRVSDVSFTPVPIPGLASSYMGDYLGITSKGGRVYPCWTDNRGGIYRTYVSPFVIGLNASFNATASNVCTGSSVTFTSNSSGPPTGWQWTFEGGSPSSYTGETPPPIVYNTAGTYDVTLVVSDGSETDTEVRTDFITVAGVFAGFTASTTSVVVTNSVTFTDNSQCTPTAWNWSFPGGSPSSFSGQNPPAIVYNTLGTYDVILTVTKGSNTDVETKVGYINVIPPEFPMANGSVTTCTGNFYDAGGASSDYSNGQNLTETFYPSTPGGMVRMTFNSFSTESGYDYLRIYNGTNTSATLLGTYNGTTGPGTVTASNAAGALTFNFTSDVSVVSSGWSAAISCFMNTDPPVAAFTASTVSTTPGTTVTLTDQSVNAPTTWSWSISPASFTYTGGTTANSQNPQVQFTAIGTYSVTLTVTNANGSDSEIKTNYISVTAATYCIPTFTSGTGYGDYITLVQLGTINNATGASASPYYTYYSSLSTDLLPNTAYTITLSPGTYGSGNYIAVWIDFNQNATFEETEKLGTVLIGATPATGTISFTVPGGATPGVTRMRVREVYANSNFDACTAYTYGETEDYNVNILSLDKNLNLALFLEGLFNGSGMNKAQNGSGNQFPGNVADQITIELRNSIAPYTLAGGPYTMNVNTDGTAAITIPAALGSTYFIVVKHRNSLETWNATPISFGGTSISYNFNSSAGQAYGNNLKLVSGQYVIYSGDVNQDGLIDSDDLISTDNHAKDFLTGYLSTDLNGDGFVNETDLQLIDSNGALFVAKITP
ncbi:MAG: PKD domain-containing protein [Bacteroidales bacterium]|nr:PKD domain-containing protein [Bacteroidales bacterium]